jgi:hypothetical protein
MPVTKTQALRADRFHYEPACTPARTERWRRNGATKLWKTRPDEFRIPVKYGLRDYSYITELNGHKFHTEADCPHGHI